MEDPPNVQKPVLEAVLYEAVPVLDLIANDEGQPRKGVIDPELSLPLLMSRGSYGAPDLSPSPGHTALRSPARTLLHTCRLALPHKYLSLVYGAWEGRYPF